MENIENYWNNFWIKPSRKLWYTAAIAMLLTLSNWKDAKAGNIIDNTKANIEQTNSKDLLDNIIQKTWTRLPDLYEEKARDLVEQSDLLKDEDIAKITEDFIIEWIKKNPGINKENRAIFVVNLCLEYILGVDVYPWDDWNSVRTQEFIKVAPILSDILEQYIFKVTPNVVAWIYRELENKVIFYNSFKESPESISQDDIEKNSQSLKRLISICDLFEVDYTKKLYLATEFYGL